MKRDTIIKVICLLLLAAAILSVFLNLQWRGSIVLLFAAGVVMFTLGIWEIRNLYWPLRRAEEKLQSGQDPQQMKEGGWTGSQNRVETLLDEVTERIRAEQDAEIYAKQIELTALQSQINPHFLYNSLDTIRGEALIDGNKEVAEMIKTLSSFFRYSISRMGTAVTLRDELDNVYNYIKIQRYRFGERFRLDTDIEDSDVLDYYVPRLIFQPIIENAIQHGLKDTLKDGMVTISVDATDDLVIVISDNGKGMTLEELDNLNGRIHAGGKGMAREASPEQPHSGIALANIHRRIELLYGAPYGVNVYSSVGKGTDVELILPIREVEEETELED